MNLLNNANNSENYDFWMLFWRQRRFFVMHKHKSSQTHNNFKSDTFNYILFNIDLSEFVRHSHTSPQIHPIKLSGASSR